MKNKLLSDLIVYIIVPIILSSSFTNNFPIEYTTLGTIFILSIYTIINKKKESRINISGVLFSTIYIGVILIRQNLPNNFDVYKYDTYLMIAMTLIIIFSVLFNRNIIKQIYIDIRKCKNDNYLRILNNIRKFNLDNDFEKISLLLTLHLISLIFIRIFSIYIFNFSEYSNSIIEIIVNIGFIICEIYTISKFNLKLRNNIKTKTTKSKFSMLQIKSKVIDIEQYRSINK